MAHGLVFYPSSDDLTSGCKEYLQVYERRQSFLSQQDNFGRRDSKDMSVKGRRMRSSVSTPSKMYMWSPEASTKLPQNNSHGYRLSFQRSLTETKLLGQRSYPEDKQFDRRGSVSSEGVAGREIVGKYLHDIGRSVPVTNVGNSDIHPIFRDGTPRQPPPSREFSRMSYSPGLGRMSRSQKDQSQKAEPADIYINLKKLVNPGNMTPQEMFSVRTPKPESSGNWRVHSNGTVRRVRTDLVLNSREATSGGSHEKTDEGETSDMKLSKSKTVLDLKTREEATRSKREMATEKTEREKSELKTSRSELERSYDKIPSMSKVNRTGNDVVIRPKHGGKQYGKSEFALNMQATISRKVLNKQALPVAFRKNNNTYLKFYGTPLLEEKTTRIYNTPASCVSS